MPFLFAFAILYPQVECSSIDVHSRSGLFIPSIVSHPCPGCCILKTIRQWARLHVPRTQRRRCCPMLRASPTSPIQWCFVRCPSSSRFTPRPSFSGSFQGTSWVFIQPQPRWHLKVALPPSGWVRARAFASHCPIHLGIRLHAPPTIHILVFVSWLKPPGAHNPRGSCQRAMAGHGSPRSPRSRTLGHRGSRLGNHPWCPQPCRCRPLVGVSALHPFTSPEVLRYIITLRKFYIWPSRRIHPFDHLAHLAAPLYHITWLDIPSNHSVGYRILTTTVLLDGFSFSLCYTTPAFYLALSPSSNFIVEHLSIAHCLHRGK